MRDRLRSWMEAFKFWAIKTAFRAPWELVILLFRLAYGFRVEGEENIPAEGPFILVVREPSLVGVFVVGYTSILVKLRVLGRRQHMAVSYMQENLLVLGYFRKLMDMSDFGKTSGMLSHAAGRMGLGLLDGYRMLRDGGLVIANPYGEGSWDGQPVPMGNAVAWLGLNSAVPLVPAVCSIGSYDIWPRWENKPYFRGQLVMRIGEPFTLVDSPLEGVSAEEMAEANARVGAVLETLCYGPDGVTGWIGPALKDGLPLEGRIDVRRAGETLTTDAAAPGSGVTGADGDKVSVWKRGIAQLLWRCPVCCTNDALVHKRGWFRRPSLHCQACGTHWAVERAYNKDFRLQVAEGPPDLIGLDMALSAWYDEMKRDFEPTPILVSGLDLLSGEDAYLEASNVLLMAYLPNPLVEGWTGREPPDRQPPSEYAWADWGELGRGRCVLTSQRLVWQGAPGELDFSWSSVTAVYLWLVKTMGITYGTARYRLGFDEESGLKWLTYVGTLAQQAADRDGHRLTVTPF